MGYKTKIKGQGVENKTSFSKFKGADYVLNRIAWDSHLKPEEFVVGYEDRFLGFIEVPFQEFSLKTEIPSQRIRFIKRSGEVVWDRRLKLIKI